MKWSKPFQCYHLYRPRKTLISDPEKVIHSVKVKQRKIPTCSSYMKLLCPTKQDPETVLKTYDVK